MTALQAALQRRSWSKVTDDAPDRMQLLEYIAAAGRVADHSNLKPWRIIEMRGADRERLGRALAKADGDKGIDRKALRAPLVLAVVASPRKSKVPEWEQDATAAGVAHVLSLVLDEAGWGVFWRTGSKTRAKAIAKAHGLRKGEKLLGWLYVGGKPVGRREGSRRRIDPGRYLSELPRV